MITNGIHPSLDIAVLVTAVTILSSDYFIPNARLWTFLRTLGIAVGLIRIGSLLHELSNQSATIFIVIQITISLCIATSTYLLTMLSEIWEDEY